MICPWLSNGCPCLPWHLRLDVFSRGKKLFLGRVPGLNPKQGQLPPGGSAHGEGLAFSAREFLSHKADLQNFLGLPEARPAAAPRGGEQQCHLNAESLALRRPDLAICHTQPAST